jgi:mono/diheme cytochrome c family protein
MNQTQSIPHLESTQIKNMKKFALLLALPLIAVACGGGESTALTTATAAPELDMAAVEAGKATFATLGCVACHGANGKGDGAAAAALEPKPRNYSDSAWQDSVTDEHIKKVILEGGAANGMSPLMAGYGAQFEGKEADLNNIVTYIRSLKE